MPSSLGLSLISLACVFGGALVGLFLQRLLPVHHLSDASKDTIKLVAATIATLSALVLGLLVSSAKNSFDSVSSAITQNGAKVILLDRVLASYGPETKGAREQLRDAMVAGIEMFWPEGTSAPSGLARFEQVDTMERVQAKLRAIVPATEAQRQLLTQAQQLTNDMLQSRWLLIEQAQNTMPVPFLVILLFWLTMLHLSFGLFAPRNTTVVIGLFVSALSVSGAILIILEMNHPLDGMIKVSAAPLRKALEHIGH